jgi:hypothetical protein
MGWAETYRRNKLNRRLVAFSLKALKNPKKKDPVLFLSRSPLR